MRKEIIHTRINGATAMTKATQAEARYIPRSRKPDERCAICTMFRAPQSCTAVEGKIAAAGWCRYFERKKTLVGGSK